MGLNIFPWDSGKEPDWVNPENGFAWYIDEITTRWCYREVTGLPKLNAICFYVTKKEGDKVVPMSRVLISRETNEVLADDSSLEAMSVKIDMLRFAQT